MKEINKIYDGAFKNKPVRLTCTANGIGQQKRNPDLSPGSPARSSNLQEKSTESFPGKSSLNLNSDKEKIYLLEKKFNQLNLKLEILENGRWYIRQGKVMVFYFIKSHEKIYPIITMCQVLGINEGTYRKWRNQIVSEKKRQKKIVQKEITVIFFEAMERYGYPRITIELQDRGYKICKSTVSKYMRELGLYSKS